MVSANVSIPEQFIDSVMESYGASAQFGDEMFHMVLHVVLRAVSLTLVTGTDRPTDHPPMLFVHSIMVRPQSDGPSLLVKHSPGNWS